MKRTVINMLAILILVCLVMSVVSCGNQTTSTTSTTTKATSGQTTTTAAPTTQTTANENLLPAIPFEEKFEFSILQGIHVHGTEQNRVRELMQEKTNSKIDWTIVAATGWTEKANVTLASGVLPDLMYFYSGTAVPGEWIEQEAVIELTDLIDRAPNVKRWLSDDVMLWMKNPDGNIYQLNMIIEFPYNLSNQIRLDWLENLGLELPHTLEEWLIVLRAFRDGDPDGNGVDDTIPWVHTFDAFFDAYGIQRGTFMVYEDKVITRYQHPNYKACLELLAGMFEEKLLDPEFIVRNKDAVLGRELIVSEKAGAWQMSGSTASSYTMMLREKNPKATFGYAPLILGPGGEHVQARNPVGACGAITVQAEDPEKLMAFWDWIYSDEGLTLLNYGEEEVHHKIVDGKPVLLAPYYESFEINRKAGMTETWVPYVWLADAFMQVTTKGKTPETLDEVDTHTYNCYMLPAQYAYNSLPSVLADTDAYRKLSADTLQPLADMQEQVIAGNATWDDMQKLLNDVEKDLEAIVTSVDANYQSVKK